MKWNKVTVDSISHVVTKGTTPTSIGYGFVDNGVPFLRVNNIQNRNLNTSDILFINQETDEALKRSRIKPKDVLLSIAGTIGRTAVVPDNITSMNCNQAVAIIRLKEVVDPYYFSYWLTTEDADRQITGSKVTGTISNLSLGCIKQLQIPLPPLEEQRRIAAILDKADEVRRKRQEAIRLTEELLRSLFLDMFGDLFSFIRPGNKIHSKGFQECSLGDQITLQRGFDITQKQCEEGPYPVVSSGGISAYHSEAKVKGPGVILGRKGSVGRVHYIESDYWPHDTTLWVKEFKKNNPIFVYYFFQDFPIYHFEASTSNPTLNRNRLHPLKVFWPDLKEQEKFANAVQAVVNYQVDERESLEKAGNLFNSLLQRAFRGEL